MRLSKRQRRDKAAPTLQLPPGIGIDQVEDILRRYDPYLRRRRRKIKVEGLFTIACRGDLLTVANREYRLARGLHHYLGGTWLVAPPEAEEHDELIEDMLRVYVPRKLLPSEPATVLRRFLTGVAIQEDADLGLFWFHDEESELTISAADVTEEERVGLATALGPLRTTDDLYECGIDDVVGPTTETAEQAWRIARAFADIGGVPIDRYGFRVTGAADLLPRGSAVPTP